MSVDFNLKFSDFQRHFQKVSDQQDFRECLQNEDRRPKTSWNALFGVKRVKSIGSSFCRNAPPSNYKTKTLAKKLYFTLFDAGQISRKSVNCTYPINFFKGEGFPRKTNSKCHTSSERDVNSKSRQPMKWGISGVPATWASQTFECESMKTSRFLRNALIKWIVKWGTQESHLKEKKYGNIGTDLQLQEDTFFIIESAKFFLFIFFFWLVFLFCSFTHGLFLF